MTRSMKIRKGIRTAELAILFTGALLDLLLVVFDKDINLFFALLISIAIAVLLLLRFIPVKYFTSQLKEVNAQSFILQLTGLTVGYISKE